MPAPIVSPQRVFARIALRTGVLGDAYHRKRSLAPLVSALCGIRGDKLDAVHLALAARLPSYKPAALLRELQEKHTLARTWGPRGTLQVVPSNELHEFLAAAGAAPRWRRLLEARSKLTPQARHRLLRRLCPTDISRDALKEGFPDASMRQVILREAAQAGHILWTRGEGAGAVFGWTRDLLGKTVEPDRDFHDVVGRYLATFGPLTAADLGAWLGVTVAAARKLMAKHHVAEVVIEGDDASTFIRPADLEELESVRRRAAKGLVVLPPGDPVAAAFKMRWRESESDDPPGLVFVDGMFAGTWAITRGEVSWKLRDEAPASRVVKAAQALVERAGVDVRFPAAGA